MKRGWDVRIFSSDADERFVETRGRFEEDPRVENELVKVYPDVTYQSVIGFGGAFTESSASLYSEIPGNGRESLIESYFGETGNRYSLCRTHIQSCDFSLSSYTYLHNPWDRSLKGFNLSRDERWLIPMMRDALAANPALSLLSSPWSPPPFMKTNLSMLRGGHLRRRYYPMWAAMLARYASEYRGRGLPVERMTIQNEQRAAQSWESCLMSSEEEVSFAVDHLRPALDEAGLADVGILAWDHNKERLVERASSAFSDERASRAISGIGFHWYSGDHFEAVDAVSRRWPDKELIMTEGCAELRLDPGAEIDIAEHYAHDIMGDLNAGANGWIDWNLLLDETGGPNHSRNFCAAPVWYDRGAQTLHRTVSYAYIGHFSRFIRPGARRVLATRFSDAIEATAFSNPDGSHVCVLLNRTGGDRRLKVLESGSSVEVGLGPHSISTLVWSPEA